MNPPNMRPVKSKLSTQNHFKKLEIQNKRILSQIKTEIIEDY